MLTSIDDVLRALESRHYITDKALATTLYLSIHLGKPILLEGAAGVGKTEVAKVMADVLDTRLIRLQCYEGLDANSALYEWNYPKQMLKIKLEETSGRSREEVEHTIFSEEYLVKRPLLDAIQDGTGRAPVLLIDEIDRSDEEFEAFLLEVLSDFQITIPELGTIKARLRPYVILTSNRTREIHNALKRRCLYHWIDYPTFEKELEIVLRKVPGIRGELARQVCAFMQELRRVDFVKTPGVAETLDWAQALVVLNAAELDADTVTATLGCILKYREDVRRVQEEGLLASLERQPV